MDLTLDKPATPGGPSLSRTADVAYPRRMTGTPTDAALMLRYRDGDLAAFETLYRRHNDALFRYLLRLSLNRAAAEDLYQEVWGRIIKARMRYRPTAKFTTYLYRIAHNCFVDHVRRNKRYSSDAPIEPDTIPDADRSSPEHDAELARLRDRLFRILDDLPEEQRDVFLLYEEAGLGLDEIAAITGVNRETAKSRLRYANRKLKAAFATP